MIESFKEAFSRSPLARKVPQDGQEVFGVKPYFTTLEPKEDND